MPGDRGRSVSGAATPAAGTVAAPRTDPARSVGRAGGQSALVRGVGHALAPALVAATTAAMAPVFVDGERIPPVGGYVVVASHPRWLDSFPINATTILLSGTHPFILALAKLYGDVAPSWLMAAVRALPVDRRDRATSAASMGRCVDALRAGGVVVVHAAGRWTPRTQPGTLRPGFVRLARAAGVPVVVVGVTFDLDAPPTLLERGIDRFRRGRNNRFGAARLAVDVLPVDEVTTGTEREALERCEAMLIAAEERTERCDEADARRWVALLEHRRATLEAPSPWRHPVRRAKVAVRRAGLRQLAAAVRRRWVAADPGATRQPTDPVPGARHGASGPGAPVVDAAPATTSIRSEHAVDDAGAGDAGALGAT